jgi:mono/diheme cytochrome c family protein
MTRATKPDKGGTFPVSLSRWHLVTLSLLLAGGCDLPGQPSEDNRPKPEDRVTDFGVLYATRCAGCHGADGKLGPAPPLNDPIFLAIVPDLELRRVIYEGRAVTPGQKSPMPGFGRSSGIPLTDAQLNALGESTEERPAAVRLQGPLTDAQVRILAEGIKKHWGPPASGSLPAYLSPTRGKGGDDKKGDRVFARACAGCHGQQGRGEKDGRALSGGAINDPAFLALISDQALRRIIITGRPDLGMPAYNHAHRPPVTAAEIDDLVALLRKWRQGEPNSDKSQDE